MELLGGPPGLLEPQILNSHVAIEYVIRYVPPLAPVFPSLNLAGCHEEIKTESRSETCLQSALILLHVSSWETTLTAGAILHPF